MLEQSQSSYVMKGARDAISQGLHHIEAQVNSIENAVLNEPGLVFDLAKTIVESTCRTILKDRAISYSSGEDLPRLFRTLSNNLPMLPSQESQATSVRESINRTLGGLIGTIHGIAELRNQLGFASHGTDRSRPSMDPAHALLAAQAADTIVGFLYHIHAQDRPQPTERESSPAQDEDFDRYVDDIYGATRIFDVEFLASEILFQMEPNSYRIFLTDFLKGGGGSGEDA